MMSTRFVGDEYSGSYVFLVMEGILLSLLLAFFTRCDNDDALGEP